MTSLQGDSGAPGEDGPQGPAGQDGEDGAPGLMVSLSMTTKCLRVSLSMGFYLVYL